MDKHPYGTRLRRGDIFLVIRAPIKTPEDNKRRYFIFEAVTGVYGVYEVPSIVNQKGPYEKWDLGIKNPNEVTKVRHYDLDYMLVANGNNLDAVIEEITITESELLQQYLSKRQ